jgi:hypothetical protein
VRTVRNKVVEQRLFPAGFIKGKSTPYDTAYVRQVGEQIHLVSFQPNPQGGEFTANLGFHYTFLPPVYQMRKITLEEMSLPDFTLRARIGLFIHGKDLWFAYGDDREALKKRFEFLVRTALNVFDRYTQRWQDPLVLVGDQASRELEPWHCESKLSLVGIQLRAAAQLDAARATLASYKEDPSPERRNLADQLREQLASLERGSRPESQPWVTR